jgi:hypothetical protein
MSRELLCSHIARINHLSAKRLLGSVAGPDAHNEEYRKPRKLTCKNTILRRMESHVKYPSGRRKL